MKRYRWLLGYQESTESARLTLKPGAYVGHLRLTKKINFQNLAKYKTFLCENEFYLHENKKIIFISMASHLALLWNKKMAHSLFTCPWRRKVEDGSSSHSAIHSNLSATSWTDMNDIFHGVKTEWNEATSSVTSIKWQKLPWNNNIWISNIGTAGEY